MQDNQRQHSGIDMARRIVSAARIAKAAAAGGVHGAAVAAAKEAAPFLANLGTGGVDRAAYVDLCLSPQYLFWLFLLRDSARFPHDGTSHDVGRVLYGSGGL